MNNETNEPSKLPAGETKGARKLTTKRIPTLPELRARALGAIQRFKESQRLPLLSRLMDKNNPPSEIPPGGLDFANFYHL